MSCRCSALGFRRSFPVNLSARLAGQVRKHGRVMIPFSGQGTLLFLFEATHDPEVLAVYLEDITLRMRSFRVHLPGQDGDVEVPETVLGRHVFDVAASTGLLNVKTHDFTFTLRLSLTPEYFPQLALAGISAPIAIRIAEKGSLNLAEGRIDTHATSFYASGGAMHALVVHPGGPDEKSAVDFQNSIGGGSDASMTAKGSIGVGSGGACMERGAADVIVCPGHAVTLCWRSSGNNPHLDVQGQAPQGLASSGDMQVTPTVDTKYHFEVDSSQKDKNGNFYHASADVMVHVVTPGMTWEMDFTANPYSGAWEQDISEFVADPSIIVLDMIIQPCPNQQTLFDSLTVVYTPPGGGSPRSFNIFAKPPATAIGVPLVGNWKLSVGGQGRDVYGTVCVSATLKCR